MNRIAHRFVVLLALVAPAAGAQTLTIPAAADTYLRQSNANKNQGLETVLHVQQSGHNRALVRMDQTLITVAVGLGSLSSATLELYVTDSGGWGADGRTIDLHRMTAAWTELGATWNCPDDTLPLNSAANCATQWNGGTFDPEASDSVLHTNDTSGYVQFNVTEDVRQFLAGTPNDGWLAQLADETAGGNVDYVSRQGSLLHPPRLVLVVESPLFDQVPPSLAITSPEHSVLINETRPQIGLSYSDGGSGVNLSSLAVQVDGVAAVCTPAATSATCLPALLAEGSHTITVSLRDQAGNQATASRGFTLLIGPGRRSATFTAVADTYLRQGNANQTFGGETTLRLRQTGKNRSLARFDTAEIRQSVGQGTLETASLELTIAKNGKNWSKTGRLVDIHRLTADWTEAGATWNCGIDTQPTNNQADCSPQWAGGSFQPTPTASVLHTSSLAGTVSFDVTADVASLLAGTPDYGWLVKKREEDRSGQVDYASREASAATAPRLVVVFDVPTGPQDTTPPALAITAPAAAVLYNQPTPQIGIQYSDSGSGIDLATLDLKIDGVSIPGVCTAGASSAVCTPPALAAGTHAIDAEVADRAGNRATGHRDFRLVIDHEAPTLVILQPSGTVYNQNPLFVNLRYSDSGAGVDLATLAVSVGPRDVSSYCMGDDTGAECRFPAPDPGSLTLAVHVTDLAGNQATASLNFDLVEDAIPPTMEVLSPSSALIEGAIPAFQVSFADAGAGLEPGSFHATLDSAELTSCVVESGGATCPLPDLPLGAHPLEAFVRDRANNQSSVFLSLNVGPETVAPRIRITSPDAFVHGRELPTVVVEYMDPESGIDASTFQLLIDDQDRTAGCQAGEASASCPALPLAPGLHMIVAEIRDHRGNQGRAFLEVELSISLDVAVTEPAGGILTRDSSVRLAGTVSPLATSVTIGDVAAVVSGGTWTADNVPVREGNNTLTVLARSTAGGVGSATVTVIRDTESPLIAILTPRDGAKFFSAEVTVAGEVLDSTSSNAAQPGIEILVNGLPAMVDHRSFVLPQLLLQPGENHIEVTATDAAGNVGRTQATVSYLVSSPVRIERIAGNFQKARVREELPEPLVVRMVDALGRPLAGRTIDFQVTRGDGAVISYPDRGRRLTVQTNAEGLAEVRFALGSRAGAGDHEVTVTSLGIPGSEVFCASADPLAPKWIQPLVGSNFQGAKTGTAGQPLPKPLLVQVLDEMGNPVPGVEVTYRAVAGGGSFSGNPDLTLVTDDEGKAQAIYTLGAGEGINNNVVAASFEANTSLAAIFTISGMVPGPAEATSISGVVLDPQDDPVPGAIISVDALATRTDAEGRFQLAGVPVGTIHLAIDGTTVTRPGTWPHLAYETVTVSGRDNNLGKPLRLPQLDDAGKVWVGGDQDVVVPMRGVAGAFLTVFAHSATFPDGSHEGWMSFTQVPTYKVPMTAPMGSNFQLAWTLQTPGVLFNPPARVTLPNFGGGSGGGYPPGLTLEIFSFDHDLNEFVSAGAASISEDGRQLVSNPGMGIAKAGWGGAPPPPVPPGAACGPGTCNTCDKNNSPVAKAKLGPITARANGRDRATLVVKDKSILFSIDLPQPPGCAVEVRWTFDDGHTSTDNPAFHAYDKTGVFHVKVEVKCMECGDDSQTDDIDIGVVDLLPSEVTFKGEGFHEVLQDTGSGPYTAPHWKDMSSPADGDADDMGDRRYPVVYKRDSNVVLDFKISTKVELTPALLQDVRVRGTGDNDFKFPPQAVEPAESSIMVHDWQSEGKLPNQIAHLDPFEIAWEISFDAGSNWQMLGRTSHRIYVTLENPIGGSTLFETVLDIGCKNAAGSTDANAAVQAIWGDFKDRSVNRKPVDGSNKPDGSPMQYWADEDSALIEMIRNQCQTLAAMIRPRVEGDLLNGIGTCRAWADLLHEIIQAQGISGSEVVVVTPRLDVNPKSNGFLVKNWSFGKHLLSGANGILQSTRAGDDTARCEKDQGLPDQVCVEPGPDNKLDTVPAPGTDDKVVDGIISTGPNGICETAKKEGTNDVQNLPVGNGFPNAYCIGPGPNGTLDTLITGDDGDRDGLLSTQPGQLYPYVLFDALNRPGRGVADGDVADQPGVGGQRTGNPPGWFNNHFVVRYDCKIYDPSYGIGPFTEKEHEDAAIDGIIAIQTMGGRSVLIAKKHDLTKKELLYEPQNSCSAKN